jgi:myo-inositol-1(or 4)-monophosphatase
VINVMANAALKAARGLVRDFGEVEQLQVSIKGPGEFVSTADLKAERTLKNELIRARPGYGLLFEEGGESAGSDPHHRWIVDPLDGTTNFLHGSPSSAMARSSPVWFTSRPATRCSGPRRASAPISMIAVSGCRRAGSSARP